MEIGLAQFGFIWLAVIFASLLRAFTGFGFALAAVPVLSLFLAPTEAVVLSSSLILAVSLLNIRHYWGLAELRPALPLLGTAVLGTAAGVLLLADLSVDSFRLWSGVLVLLASAVMVFYTPSTAKAKPWVAGIMSGFSGLLAGLMNGVLAMPGPAIIIFSLYSQPDPQRSRAQLMILLMIAAGIALIAYGAAGFITAQSLINFLVAMPAMILGDRLGFWLFHRFGHALYRNVAIVTLFLIGLMVLMSALV